MASSGDDGAVCVIDTDPGIDDALAILLALRSPELDVVALTTVHGNVPLAHTTRNALRVLELMGRQDIPVYRGADRPLRREPFHAADIHGDDGLAGAELPEPAAAAREGAVDFLVGTVGERGAGLTIVCLGPLTNLALAEERKPGILARAGRIVTMGGAVAEPGNVTPTAEFNFFADPNAARQVLLSGARVTVVPLDVTRRVMLTGPIGDPDCACSPCEALALRVVGAAMDRSEQAGGVRRFYLHDPLAVGVAVDPSLCGFERLAVDVETQGELTAGQLVADRRAAAAHAGWGGQPCECAVTVDADRFLKLFRARVMG